MCEQHLVQIETDEKTNQPVCRRLVLEFADDKKTNAVVEVHKKLVQQLKPHQAEGIVENKIDFKPKGHTAWLFLLL